MTGKQAGREWIAQLGKDALVYGIGGVLSKGVGFLLLPVYTRLLTPGQYGTVELLTVLSSLLAAVIVTGTDSSQSYFFFEEGVRSREGRSRLVSSIVLWRVLWGGIVVAAALGAAPVLDRVFFGGRLHWLHFAAVFIGCLFLQLMRQGANLFRLLHRPWGYIGVTLSNTVLASMGAVALIAWLNLGVLGYFVGMAAAAVVTAVGAWWHLRDYLRLVFSVREWWLRVLRFGVPLVPAAIAMYVMSTADRWFVERFLGEGALGLYAVGAKFALGIGMAVHTFRQAWWPVAMDAMHSGDGPEVFRTVGRLYLGLGSGGLVLLTALSPVLVRMLTPVAYHSAYPIVGVLAWHAMFYGFYLVAVGGIYRSERTGLVPLLMGGAAVLNVVLNFVLIPKMGIMGAALATSVTFLVWIVACLAVSERLWPVGFPIGVFALQVGLGAVACGGILWELRSNYPLMAVALTTATALVILLWTTLSRQELQWLIRRISRRMDRN